MSDDPQAGPPRWVAPAAILVISGIWLPAAAFWAETGHYLMDAMVYRAMIDAFVGDQSLFVENGYAAYRVPSLQLHFFNVNGDRLAAQYPGGWGILGAPGYFIAGVRGLLVQACITGILTMVLVWQTARTLFEDRRIELVSVLVYALGSYAVDYNWALSPHAPATFTATLAVYAGARAWRATPGREPLWALCAGLAIGTGLHIRADVVLVLPAIGVFLLATGRHPYRAAAMLLLGLVPGVAAASAINWIKFGSLSPVTYGRPSGGVSLGGHAEFIALSVVLGLASLTLGLARVRAVVLRPRVIGAIALVLAAIVLAVPETRAAFVRVAEGFRILVIDLQTHPLPNWRILVDEEGTLYGNGALKKALLQSMPFVAAVVVLAPGLFFGRHRPQLAYCLMVAVFVILPFTFTAWWGGTGNNMRYFLHAIPEISILAAVAAIRVFDARGGSVNLGRIALVAALGVGLLWPLLVGYSVPRVLRIDLPNTLVFLLAVSGLAMISLPSPMRMHAASAAKVLLVPAFLAAFVTNYVFDLSLSQAQRKIARIGADRTADLPPDALFIAHDVRNFAMRLNRPPALTAHRNIYSRALPDDLKRLVSMVQAESRPIYVARKVIVEELRTAGLIGRAEKVVETPFGGIYRVRPRNGD